MFSIIKIFYHRTLTHEKVIVNKALSYGTDNVSKFIVKVIDDGEASDVNNYELTSMCVDEDHIIKVNMLQKLKLIKNRGIDEEDGFISVYFQERNVPFSKILVYC